MSKKITIIHTTMATVSTIPNMIKEMYGDKFEIVNVMDDSLLNEIKTHGSITKSVIERFVQYAIIAKNNKSDAILLACSSIGEAADVTRNIVDISLFKIDEPMAELAISKGNRILVLGTVKSTLEPTSNLIKTKVLSNNQIVTCKQIENVFELYQIDRELHDKKIAEVVDENINDYDVIVLAQASMANAIKYINGDKNKILTSLPLGLKQLESLINV